MPILFIVLVIAIVMHLVAKRVWGIMSCMFDMFSVLSFAILVLLFALGVR